VLQQTEQETPIHRIKSLSYIKFDQSTWDLGPLQQFGRRLHSPIILVDESGLNESTLIEFNQAIHVWS